MGTDDTLLRIEYNVFESVVINITIPMVRLQLP